LAALPPFAQFLSAHNNLIAQIPTAEFAVATNGVALAQKRGFACAVYYC